MPHHLIVLLIATAGAHPVDYTLLGDAAHPNCPARSCVIKEGARVFDVTMETEEKKELTYLRRVRIKPRIGKDSAQEFATPAVNAAETHDVFKLYAVKLRSKNVTDLALLAFDSAQAGPSYYYYLYDPATRQFVASESTIPRLVRDEKTQELKTELQGVPFVIDDLKLREK